MTVRVLINIALWFIGTLLTAYALSRLFALAVTWKLGVGLMLGPAAVLGLSDKQDWLRGFSFILTMAGAIGLAQLLVELGQILQLKAEPAAPASTYGYIAGLQLAYLGAGGMLYGIDRRRARR